MRTPVFFGDKLHPLRKKAIKSIQKASIFMYLFIKYSFLGVVKKGLSFYDKPFLVRRRPFIVGRNGGVKNNNHHDEQ